MHLKQAVQQEFIAMIAVEIQLEKKVVSYKSNSLSTIFENEYLENNCIYTNFMV